MTNKSQIALMADYNEAYVKTNNFNKTGETNMTNVKATTKGTGMQVTQDNLQDIIATMTEEDKNYLLLNNIRIVNPASGKIGERFKHYFEVTKDCKHENTVRNSYERRSGNSYYTVCSDCGHMFFE